MSKSTKQASGRRSTTRERRSTGASTQSGGAIFTWMTRGLRGLSSLLKENFRNRRIATVLGLQSSPRLGDFLPLCLCPLPCLSPTEGSRDTPDPLYITVPLLWLPLPVDSYRSCRPAGFLSFGWLPAMGRETGLTALHLYIWQYTDGRTPSSALLQPTDLLRPL